MLFRQIVFYSLLVGLLAGSVLTVVQKWQVIPIIKGAETFEKADEPALVPFLQSPGHTHSGLQDGSEEWAPADGGERTAFTLLSNVLTAIGFALLVVVAMYATKSYRGGACSTWRYGLLWGAAGYTVFWLAPALGHPPAIPLAASAELEQRQLWWLFTVMSTALALGMLAFVKAPWRWGAVVLLLAPHLVGAPYHEGAMFAEHPPETAAALELLAQQFIGATAIANAALWLVLGLAGSWALRRIQSSAGDSPKPTRSEPHSV